MHLGGHDVAWFRVEVQTLATEILFPIFYPYHRFTTYHEHTFLEVQSHQLPLPARYHEYLQQSSKLGQIDVSHLSPDEHRAIVDQALQTTDQDNEKFLRKLRERIDRQAMSYGSLKVFASD